MLSVSVYMLGPIPDSSSGSSLLSVKLIKPQLVIMWEYICMQDYIVMTEAKMLYGYIPTPACED